MVDLVVGDITFLFKDARDLFFNLRVRQFYVRSMRGGRVAKPGQEIGNRISQSTHTLLGSRLLGRQLAIAERHAEFS